VAPVTGQPATTPQPLGTTIPPGSLFFYDYSQSLSGTTIANNGSQIIGSSLIGTAYALDYSRQYTGSVSLVGSQLIGSQLINGSYAYNYDYIFTGSNYTLLGSSLGSAYKIFTGILEDIKYEGEGLDETLELSGRDTKEAGGEFKIRLERASIFHYSLDKTRPQKTMVL